MVRKSTVKPANKELQNNNAKHQINTNHSISYLRIQPNNCVCQLPKLRSSSDTRVLTVHKSKCEIDLDNIYANGNYGSVSSRQIPPGGGVYCYFKYRSRTVRPTDSYEKKRRRRSVQILHPVDKVEMYFSRNLTMTNVPAP